MLVVHLLNKERIQKFIETGNTGHTYKNDLDKACFQHKWLLVNIKIWLKEQSQIRFSELRLLKLQAIRNMMVSKRTSFNGIQIF